MENGFLNMRKSLVFSNIWNSFSYIRKSFCSIRNSCSSNIQHSFFSFLNSFLCCLWSIVAHRDHFVRRLSVCLSVRHTFKFLVVTHSYVSQATHAFLGMLPLRSYIWNSFSNIRISSWVSNIWKCIPNKRKLRVPVNWETKKKNEKKRKETERKKTKRKQGEK